MHLQLAHGSPQSDTTSVGPVAQGANHETGCEFQMSPDLHQCPRCDNQHARVTKPPQKPKGERSWWLTPVILATSEAEGHRWKPAWQIDHEIPVSKIIRKIWAGGVIEVVESLLYKHETMSSNPSPTENKSGLMAPLQGPSWSAFCVWLAVAEDHH
jgi:hypothetical protein